MAKRVIQGVSLAPGIAKGRLYTLPRWQSETSEAGTRSAEEPAEELQRFKEQAALLREHLHETASELEAAELMTEAGIVRGHALFFEDPEFQQRVEEAVRGEGLDAEAAVNRAIRAMAGAFEGSPFEAFGERAAELRDLGAQLQRRLAGDDMHLPAELCAQMTEPILALPELLPSLVLEARRYGIRAFVVEKGTPLSHAAILAKSFGLPVLRISTLDLLQMPEGTVVLVDGDEGRLMIEPTGEERTAEERTAEERTAEERTAEERTVRPKPPAAAVFSPGEVPAVRIWVSIMTPEQLEGFDWEGVEGVGLYRTEMLFLQDREDFVTEAEQIETYSRLVALCGARPVTIRTLDVGTDKMLPYMAFGPQENPQLGLRAHRLYRFHPELLVTQVRAILRAGIGAHDLRIMYPMIESLEQWRFVQGLTEEARASLRVERLNFQEKFQRGPLVETPSAVWAFARLLAEADFVGVGTNDLVQYLFAVDRSNANVARLYRPEHPVVLQVLKSLAEQARAAGKNLSICGEMAADLRLVPLLIGLGVEDLSVDVRTVPAVRALLPSLSLPNCVQLAEECLAAESVEEVEAILARWHGSHSETVPASIGERVDPICGMVLDPATARFKLTHRGVPYFFCSRKCLEAFLVHPPSDG